MLHRFYSWPIRVHLTILIALLAIPSISLIVYSGMAGRRDAIAGAKAECLKFVNDVAGQQQAIVAGAEQLAVALSLLPSIRSGNVAVTNALLADLVKKNPQYGNIYVIDKSGLIWASATPFEGKVSVADRRYFREAIRTGMFSSGEYLIGRIVKKPTIGFGYPVKNTANELIAVITVGLNLDYVQHMFEKLDLPPNSSFSLLDHQGIILIRNLNLPSSETLIGRRDPREENFTKMKGNDEGTFEAMANDGFYRLAGYKKLRLSHEPEPYLYVRASIPLASAVSKANGALFRNLSAFVSLFLVGLFLAWFIGRRVIVGPAMMLKAAAGRLAAGADNVDVSSAVKGGELGEVARAFDGMAETLVQEKTALRTSEQRWATTLASIGDAVIATDVAGNITFMNAVAEEMTGWTLRDASGKPVTEVFHIINEQTRGEVENPVTKVLREGMIVGLANHTVLVRKDGTEVAIDDSGAPIRDADGKTMGVVLVFHDITERKRMEEALRQTEERFRLALKNAPVSVAVQDRNFVYQWAYNQRTRRTDEIVGKTDADLFAPEDLSGILEVKRRVLESGTEEHVQHWLTSNGRRLFLDLYYEPLRDSAGEITGIGIAVVDLTEQRRAEEALRDSERLYRAIGESIDYGVWVCAPDGRNIYASESFLKMVGMTQEQCSNFGWGDVLHPDDAERTIAGWKECVETGGTWDIEHRFRGADGQWHPVLARGVAVKNEHGEIKYWVGINLDISRIKQAEEALQKAHDSLELRVRERTVELSQAYEKLQREMSERERLEDRLRQAHKMEAVGTLAGGIAHDFNNILAAILGFTEMAADDVVDRPEVGRNLQKVLKSAMRARELVKQILAFSRKTKYERTPLSLTPLINETIQFLRASIPATIEIRLAVTASSDHILAAPVEVQQILMNLATNASLAMQDKGGTLEISLTDIDFKPDSPVMEPDVMPGEYLQLMVKDTGIGMSPDVMKRVFEPFFTTREVGKGTGMGLAVVYGIVNDLQGTITVESAPGVGSTFRVLLPKIRTAIEKKEQVPAVETPRGTERILFVDDEQMLLEWGQATLERLGYSVVALSDSTEALRTFSSDPSRFDLVVTDQTMSGMTGVQLAKELLTIRHDIPIILCTGHSEAVSPETAKDVGIRQFLMKPVAKQELAQTIRRVLDANAEE